MEEKACWKLGRKTIIYSAAQFRFCRFAACRTTASESRLKSGRRTKRAIFNLQSSICNLLAGVAILFGCINNRNKKSDINVSLLSNPSCTTNTYRNIALMLPHVRRAAEVIAETLTTSESEKLPFWKTTLTLYMNKFAVVLKTVRSTNS